LRAVLGDGGAGDHAAGKIQQSGGCCEESSQGPSLSLENSHCTIALNAIRVTALYRGTSPPASAAESKEAG